MSAPADIVVIGAGPWGLMTAWRAAQAGACVTVVGDQQPPAATVAAGMLGPWAEAAEGEEDMHALMVRALERWPDVADELAGESGLDPGYRRSGALLVAARAEHIGVVRRRIATIRSWGHPAEWIGAGDLRRIEPGLGPSAAGGMDLPDEHQAEPRAFLAALHAATLVRGVRHIAGTVSELSRRPRVIGVRLSDGRRLAATRVVLAAGHAAGGLSGRVAVRPVKGQILRLAAVAGAPLPISRTIRTPSVYLAPRDGELVVGATMEERADRRVTAAAVRDLLDEALHVVPEIGEMELVEIAAGLRPATPDGRPVLGVDPDDGLVWAAGGYRHGVLLTPIAGEVAAAAALGDPCPVWAQPFSPTRLAVCA